MSLTLRLATPADHPAIWAILRPIFRAGDTYTIDTDISEHDALSYWAAPGNLTYVAEDDTGVLGTFYIKRNQGGRGAHVCNCGFATSLDARGKGVARAMLAHSLTEAPKAGYRAMQFNFVVSTNTRAIAIWERAGFDTVGRLPGAFDHPEHGEVDALVMYKKLAPSD